ncbi:MAG TPA: hypothetical protein VFI52_05540 [Gemmatimonadaceae bacterium]|nr:hypothetical protein [Gemmatimonadaceae bacterium]
MIITPRVLALLTIIALGAGCISGEREESASTAQRATTVATTSRVGCCTRLITGDGVGTIRIGVSLDSVRGAYPVIRDTTVQLDVKERPAREVSVLMGADTAVLSVQGGRVSEVLLTSRRFATSDSLGVGTTLKRLLGYALPKGYGVGGQLIVATAAHCGLSFHFAGRFDGLPEGFKDSTVLRRFPPEALVDRVRIDGCEQGDEQLAEDDSTYDVVTDSVLLVRDLDGNGVNDFVAIENRPFRRSTTIRIYRLAVYLDSISARRAPAWATAWDMETDRTLDRIEPLARGSLLVVGGNGGDYSSETLIVARDGTITEELTHGEDYGDGYFRILREGGTLVVDASQKNLLVRGKPVPPELDCPRNEWAGVRMRWDEPTRRFVPDAPRCVKQRSE